MLVSRCASIAGVLIAVWCATSWAAEDPDKGATDFMCAWANDDVPGMIGVFSPNGELFDAFGNVRRGQNDIQSLLNKQHGKGGFLQGSRFKILGKIEADLDGNLIEDFSKVSEPVLQEWNVYLINMKDPQGRTTPALHLHVLVLWVKKDTKWFVRAAHTAQSH